MKKHCELLDGTFNDSRRRAIKLIAIGLPSVSLHRLLIRNVNAAEVNAKEIISESDPQAEALKYKRDATQSLIRKDVSQFCWNCGLATPASNDIVVGECQDYFACAIFQGKLVAAHGWCAAWVRQSGGNSTLDPCNTNPPETSLIEHYYISILGREPDASGLAYWQGLIADCQAQGLDVKPVFRDMANFFFNSPEYLRNNTSDTEFIFNLYRTFFQREPDGDGLFFWLNQLMMGVSRNVVMSGFLYSPEFTNFMEALGL